MSAALAAALTLCAVWLALPPRPSTTRAVDGVPGPPRVESALVRHRVVVSVMAALGGFSFFEAPLGWVVAGAAFVAVWVTIGRTEPPSVRREREQAMRDLPQVIQLIGLVLASGGSLADAIRQVAAAFPGPAVQPLRRAEARLVVGMAPVDAWRELATQPGFEQVGRALVRAESAGVPASDLVRRLGLDLARDERARAEDRARTVGVRAAVPLGLCLLPAFLVVGIVPVVASALSSFQW